MRLMLVMMGRAILVWLFAAVAIGQAPAEFDVASVKPNRLGDRIVTIHFGPGGQFSVRGYSLKLLIQQAYGVMGWQISGGPGWLDDDRYDVKARIAWSHDLTQEEAKPMLQALLADRFQLRVPPRFEGCQRPGAGRRARRPQAEARRRRPRAR